MINSTKQKETEKFKKALYGELPTGTLLYKNEKNNFFIAFILKAGIRTINFGLGQKSSQIKIDFPELLITFSSRFKIHMFVINDKSLYVPGLKNFNDDGSLCIGNCPIPIYDKKTPAEICKSVISTIFDGKFTNDLNEHGYQVDELKAILKATKKRAVNIKREEFLSKSSKQLTTLDRFINTISKSLDEETN